MQFENKSILFVYDGIYATCPRPKRLIRYFADNNQIDIVCRTLEPVPEVRNNFSLSKRLLSPFFEDVQGVAYKMGWLRLAWHIEKKRFYMPDVKLAQYDVIFIHDLHLLPYFESVLHKVVFDAREYYPLQYSSNKEWAATKGKLLIWLCEHYLSKCRSRITVSASIRALFEKWLKVPFQVLRSCPDFTLPELHDRPRVSKPIRIIHHGGAIQNRNLENLISLAQKLGEGFELYLMLMPTQPAYLQQLKEVAKAVNNVHFIEPVPFEQIVPTIAQYDIGIHLMDASKDQHQYALPNKFFEYVAAGLMLVVSGSREMCELTKEHALGLAFSEKLILNDIVLALKTLTDEQIQLAKSNSEEARLAFRFEHEIASLSDSRTVTTQAAQ